jgi:hypothetical protein
MMSDNCLTQCATSRLRPTWLALSFWLMPGQVWELRAMGDHISSTGDRLQVTS